MDRRTIGRTHRFIEIRIASLSHYAMAQLKINTIVHNNESDQKVEALTAFPFHEPVWDSIKSPFHKFLPSFEFAFVIRIAILIGLTTSHFLSRHRSKGNANIQIIHHPQSTARLRECIQLSICISVFLSAHYPRVFMRFFTAILIYSGKTK